MSTTAEGDQAIECSLYDALYTSVAEATGVSLQQVSDALTHREVPDDGFWYAWDEAVREGIRMLVALGIASEEEIERRRT